MSDYNVFDNLQSASVTRIPRQVELITVIKQQHAVYVNSIPESNVL